MRMANLDRQTLIAIIAQLLQHGSSFLILPLILFKFSPESLGVWYVLVSFQAFAFLLDMGLTQSFSRSVSQALSGVKQLNKSGLGEGVSGGPNEALVSQLVSLMYRVYGMIAFGAFVLLLLTSVFYFQSIELQEFQTSDIAVVCILTSLSVATQLGSQPFNAYFIGSGSAFLSNVSVLISRGVFLALGLSLVSIDFGVIGLLAANLVGLIASTVFKVLLFRRKCIVVISAPSGPEMWSLLKRIWRNCWRLGVVGFATFLVLRSGVLILGAVESVDEAGKLGLAVQISTALIAAAMMPWQVGLRTLIQRKLEMNVDLLRGLVISFWCRSILIFVFGSIVLIMLGYSGYLADTAVSTFVNSSIFILYLFFALLELNHTAATYYISAGNEVPFLKSAIISALLSVSLSTYLVVSGFGIVGIVLAQGLIQLGWNNWFWPLKVVKEFRRTKVLKPESLYG